MTARPGAALESQPQNSQDDSPERFWRRGTLTEDVELDDLLSEEGAESNGADVAALVPDLQTGQGHGGVALGNNLGDVHAGAPALFTY